MQSLGHMFARLNMCQLRSLVTKALWISKERNKTIALARTWNSRPSLAKYSNKVQDLSSLARWLSLKHED